MTLSKLSEPFPASDIEWRVGQCGLKQNGEPWVKVLAYVTNRAIMERLDAVCGPENWQNEYKQAPCGGVLCGLSIYIEDRGVGDRWVTKWDGAANTEVNINGKPDEDTNIKGGLSASMKRAGSQWGIGRYLYGLEDGFATIVQKGFKGARSAKTKDGKWFYWIPPQLPTWALPQFKNLEPAISAIKEGIAAGNYLRARDAWQSLTDEEKGQLWIAPSKGGVFTTKEREIMKTTEFRKGISNEPG